MNVDHDVTFLGSTVYGLRMMHQSDEIANHDFWMVARPIERRFWWYASQFVILYTYCHQTHPTHQQTGEQRARQQDGEEVHQADEKFWGFKIHSVPSLSSAHQYCAHKIIPILSTKQFDPGPFDYTRAVRPRRPEGSRRDRAGVATPPEDRPPSCPAYRVSRAK
jgi:hypothetical protein